ncbi:MAG: amidophosphoribosyltransferase [Prevotellaceae bacterium]|jgi:amidophosphoribosyltransferase|nr:amidophosphoribosyltransferase [Prevotellaceae bacterium]
MGGFFGVTSKSNCSTELFYGTDYHSHLGTKRGGMACFNPDGSFVRSIHNIENSHFRNKFEEELYKFTGNSGIGVISDTDAQPIVIHSHLGKFAIVTVGRINNLDPLAQELIAKGKNFNELSSGSFSPTELVAQLITSQDRFEEGISYAQERINGSCSILILSSQGIIAARDRYGRTPIVIGKKDGAYSCASESCSFPNLGFSVDRFLGPGEAVSLTPDGCTRLLEPQNKLQICSFLWMYYGYPSSFYEGINVDEVRYRSGMGMGEADTTPLDCVSGIPDSGTCMAIGFGQGKGVPYRNAVVKYTPTWPRSFTPSNQHIREVVARMKLIPNQGLLTGKRVAFCDDSIVRGTQLKGHVNRLYEYGTKEVHIRISCPPLIWVCPFLNFTSSMSQTELITRRIIEEFEGNHTKNLSLYADSQSNEYKKMVLRIAQLLSVNSLTFSTLKMMTDAIGCSKEQICTHCFDGSGVCE